MRYFVGGTFEEAALAARWTPAIQGVASASMQESKNRGAQLTQRPGAPMAHCNLTLVQLAGIGSVIPG